MKNFITIHVGLKNDEMIVNAAHITNVSRDRGARIALVSGSQIPVNESYEEVKKLIFEALNHE